MKGFDEDLENDAILHFLGKHEGNWRNLLFFNAEYDIKALIYLTHLQDATECLKYVFISGIKEQLISQLQFLNILANRFQTPALFISPYPSDRVTVNSRFICGVLFNNQLLLINPLEAHWDRDLIDVLTTLTEGGDLNSIRRIYVANDVILKNLSFESSCGPICIELLKMLNQQADKIKLQFEYWSNLPLEKESITRTLLYTNVNIDELCMSDLLIKLKLEKNVRPIIQEIRRHHFEEIKDISLIRYFQSNIHKEQASLIEQNAYLLNNVIEAPEQVLVCKYLKGLINVYELNADENFVRLYQRLMKYGESTNASVNNDIIFDEKDHDKLETENSLQRPVERGKSVKNRPNIYNKTTIDYSKITINVGEGRTLDSNLVATLEKVALNSDRMTLEEKEFIKELLNHKDLEALEDWEFIKLKSLFQKTNVKITFQGRRQLEIKTSDESRRFLIMRLREYYTKDEQTKLHNLLSESEVSQDIGQAFINLAIVRKQKGNETDNTNLYTYVDSRMQSSHEQIYGKKEDIPLNEIFDTYSKVKKVKIRAFTKRVLIEGWAGIGKTVLCQYLTVMWARNSQDTEKRWWLDNTQVVLWIRLRNLTHYDPGNCRMGEVVRRECFGVEDSEDLNYPSASQIEADLEYLGEKVVLLLDGFDEVAEWYDEIQSGTQQVPTARSELIKHVFLGDRYRHRIILTSRPSRVEQIVGKFDRRLETIGFKDVDIKKYVTHYYYGTPQLGKLLLFNMRHNKNLWGIAHVPVNLVLICLIWKSNIEKTEIPQSMTMTTLYNEAILWLLRRDWEKHPIWNNTETEMKRQRLNDLGECYSGEAINESSIRIKARELSIEDFEVKLIPYSKKLMLLEKLAWEAQLSSKSSLLIVGDKIINCLQQYYEAQLKDDDQKAILCALRKLGMLESVFNDRSRLVKNNSYYFPHLTFQEYFAAKYWVKLYCSINEKDRIEAVRLFKMYKYYPKMEVVWWFTAGLLGQQCQERIHEFFELIREKPVEIIGLRHLALSVRCMEESRLVIVGNIEVEWLLEEVKVWIDTVVKENDWSNNMTVLYRAMEQSPNMFTHTNIDTYISKLRHNEQDQIKSIVRFAQAKLEKVRKRESIVPVSDVEREERVRYAWTNSFRENKKDKMDNITFKVLPAIPWDLLSERERVKYNIELPHVRLKDNRRKKNSKWAIIKVLSKQPMEQLTLEHSELLLRSYTKRLKKKESNKQMIAIYALRQFAWWTLFEQRFLLKKYSLREYTINFLRFCIFTESLVYLNSNTHAIEGFNTQGYQIVINNSLLFDMLLNSFEDIRENLHLPRIPIKHQRREEKKSPSLSQSRDRFSFQSKESQFYECCLGEFKINIQVNNLPQKMKILILADHAISFDQVIIVKKSLISFLKKQFGESTVNIESLYGTSLEVIANPVILEEITSKISLWLQNDFPIYYLEDKNNTSWGCCIC